MINRKKNCAEKCWDQNDFGSTKFWVQKKFQVQKILGPTKFGIKFFGSKIFLGPNKFGLKYFRSKKILCFKKIWSRKILVPKIFGSKTFFWAKKSWGTANFGVHKMSEIFWFWKFWVGKILGLKTFRFKRFLVPKNFGFQNILGSKKI